MTGKWIKNILTASASVMLLIGTGNVSAQDNSNSTELTTEDIQIIQDVYNSIQQQYIHEIDKKTLLEGALKGMVTSIGDPYSEYLNAEESQAFEEDISSSFEGIGVQFSIRNGKVVVISPIDGTPAAKAGIQPNDIFLKADDTELTESMTTKDIVKLIRGPKGSEIKITIQRGDSVFDVKLIRDTIPVYSVTGTIDEENAEIGNIRITQFAENTAGELETKIKELREKGAKKFIFDLRSNPGGLLDQALRVANMFVEDGATIMQVEERNQPVDKYYANPLYGTLKIKESYIMLINDGSASASEILAAAVSENTDSKLVGIKTFGKGTVQTVANQSELGELKLTIAKWLTPSGTWVHDNGISPDVEVDSHPAAKVILLDTTVELKKGQSSDFVESLATMMQAIGYDVTLGNYFDDKLEAAVKQFQKDNKLEETGIVMGDTAQLIMDKTREFVEGNDIQYKAARDILLGVQ